MIKKQFNVRLKEPLRAAVVQVADKADFTRDEIAEVALANLLGTQDELILAKRNKVQRIVAQLKIELTFNAAQLPLFGRLAA